jgi:hypothetical protein
MRKFILEKNLTNIMNIGKPSVIIYAFLSIKKCIMQRNITIINTIIVKCKLLATTQSVSEDSYYREALYYSRSLS